MKNDPIHQNLSTSFVDVMALVEHLRGLQFVGSVRLEMSSYEAEIRFTPEQRLRAREFDHHSGRISVGREALKRILRRAREPHGRVSVFPDAGGTPASQIFIDRTIARNARAYITTCADGPVVHLLAPGSEVTLSGEGETLVDLLSELLKSMDESLARANLNFPDAFRNACGELRSIYPFFHPASRAFRYANERVVVTRFIEPGLLAAAVGEALLTVVNRLRREPKFRNAYLISRTRIEHLFQVRRRLYDRFLLSEHIAKLLRD